MININELKIKLICKEGFTYKDDWLSEEIQFDKKQIVNAIVRDEGIRFEYKEKHYTFALTVNQICKYFKTEYED